MTPVEWILVIMLAAPGGQSTTFESDERYQSYAKCMEHSADIARVWDPAEYLDSWCRPVDSTDTMIV